MKGPSIFGHVIWLITMVIIWFVCDDSVYRLIFCATGLISFLIMNITNAIYSYSEIPKFFANQIASLTETLELLNEKIDTANENLESISGNTENTSEEKYEGD